MQQDLKLALVAPLVCAIFRFIFIRLYAPDKSFMGQERKWLDCFRFGFWWGMDFNAYVFLILFAVVTVPGVFVSAYFLVGNYFRIGLLAVYMFVLYAAFMGKLIFYFHFHDIYNPTVRLGGNADKRNFLDIFLIKTMVC